MPSQIRPMGCRTAMSMANGMVRSATLRRMVDRVGELNGIVYIEDRDYVNDRTRQVLSGALLHHITVAGAYRVLHLLVAPESGNRQLTTIAHELQHAIEVLEATEVESDAAVDRLFERIGVNTSAGVMETQAALDMERAVGRELSAERSSSNESIGTRLDLATGGTGITDLVSRTPIGRPANGPSLRPVLSQDGATVAFQSLASNLVCEGTCQGGQPDINPVWDVFVYDRLARGTARVSTDIVEEWMANSRAPSLDDAGPVLAFGSRHPINGRDEAHDDDLYVYRLPTPAAHRVPLTIMLHVDDYAAIPRKLLLRAEARANTVYTLAGVETLWVNRSMPQEQHSEGSALAEPVSSHAVHLRLIILSDEMTQRKLRESRHGSDVIGLAQAAPELSNTVAFVFFARLERAADRHIESTSDVLGHVMAHELGHLILEHGSHSDTGIMRDTWESNEMRTPVFTVEQAAMIRTRLLAAGASEIK